MIKEEGMAQLFARSSFSSGETPEVKKQHSGHAAKLPLDLTVSRLAKEHCMNKDISMNPEKETGTRDTTYNLISVAYHALQGAENYSLYAQDAQENGNSEAERFFKECQEEEKRRADKAKKLLKKQLEMHE
jgi:methylthioribose-1-phosphate isomerase